MAGLTQEQAAAVFRVSLHTYSKWERDEVEPQGRDHRNAREVQQVLARHDDSVKPLRQRKALGRRTNR